MAILLAGIAMVACRTGKLPVDTSSASIDTGPAAHALIEDALAAKGGKAKLASLESLRLIAVGTTTLDGKRVLVETTRVLVLPDKVRVDARLTRPGEPPTTVSAALSGKTGWQSTVDPKPDDVVATELAGQNLEILRFELWREPELILLKAADPAAVVSVVPDDTVAGGDVYSVVRLQSPFNVDLFLYIDKKTKLLGRMIYSDGRKSESDDFGDYRDVGGLQFAYKRTNKTGDRSTAFELKTVEVDPEIDVTLFDKPANASAGSQAGVADSPPDRVAATLAKMAQFRDEMCRCDDQPCVDRVYEAIRRWQQDTAEYPTHDSRPWTREESRRSSELSAELDVCSTPGQRPPARKDPVAAPQGPLVVAPPPPPPPPPPPLPPRVVSAATLEVNRITGDKNIVPDDATRKAMVQRGGKFTGAFKVCVAPDGSVAQVSVMQSTGFPSYDQTIIKQIRAWRYRPFTARHAPPGVCAAMVFIYHAS